MGELAQVGALKITDLAESLQVSEVTIRRDIDVMAEQGLLSKVHGGVTLNSMSLVNEPPFSANSKKELQAKVAIAQKAFKLIRPGMAIALMGGSTVYELAKRIKEINNITVVTNSVPVSNLFAQQPKPQQTVVITGGVRTPTDSLVGSIASETFARFNLDLIFMGTHGIDEQLGFSSPNLIEGETNRSVMNQSGKKVILADHTKWGVKAFSGFGKLSSADILITTSGLSDEAHKKLSAKIGQVIKV
jgi:DeoR/GlpR family transcriptional regulator of sugar metabolism